ncbi:MAG: sensor domain-containing diguanylate cyclase [Firmicutes bacterium]|nr:sensor domain-containing diguanylate cyclase [Bacillota bacterium]
MELTYSEYQAIVEFSPNMIWRSGLDANCNYFNDTWLKFTGKKMADEVGAGWLTRVHSDDMQFCMKTYLAAFKKREAFEMEYRLLRYDGEWRWINDRGVPFKNTNGMFAGYIGSCVDVTEKIEGRKLTDMAFNDYLTKVYNRNYLEPIINYEFNQAKKEAYDVFYMMLDVDQFKLFNDKFGHTYGDRVLFMVAQEIRKSVRNIDTVGRYGGDEFMVILPKSTILVAQQTAQKILEVVSKLHMEKIKTSISVSIGIVKQSNEGEIEDILKKVDDAMYQAKNEGGNCFTFWTE